MHLFPVISSCQSPVRNKYTISYSHGQDFPTSLPLQGKTIGQVLDDVTEASPDTEFVVSSAEGIRKTYLQFREEADRFAAGLLSIGIRRSDRLGVWAPNSYSWVLTQFAAARIGAILVNLNPAYQKDDIQYSLKKVGIKAIVASGPYKTQHYYNMLAESCPELQNSTPGHIKSKTFPQLESVIVMGDEAHPGAFSMNDVMQMGGAEERALVDQGRKTLQFDDVINIQFTSGTTGSPKATSLTHFGLLNNMRIIEFMLPKTSHISSCVPTPLFHLFGMGAIIISLINGGKVVLPSDGFDADACIRAMEEERCSHFFGTPTMLIDMLHHPELQTFDLRSFTCALTGGSMVPKTLADKLRSVIPSMEHFVIVYGMTESSGAITISRKDDAPDVRFSTVGRAAPWYEVKIIDPSTGEIVPLGSPGELCARSPCNMAGYWGDEEKTRETIDQAQWLHTGDLGTMDEDGYVRIVGRSKDVIIRGGENIFPAHIEQLLFNHPKVEDVYIVGVPDKRMIEELCACVKLKEGLSCSADEIRQYCKGKIAHYEIPRYVEFVSSFPLTMSNKVQKFKLSEQMIQKLGLEESVD
ncbi:medium-chain acyl-CoA ligase ACSF2, mitochondrial-like [Diadema setosum]|uniref:medium-chain acyl-CoA ligase ACSF2, mitochondrial-like n=1 Tax=Diadema setosum TaxID=31175 RepID=UPI003B3B5A6A